MARQRKKMLKTDASQVVAFLPPHPILTTAMWQFIPPLPVWRRGRKSYVQHTVFWGEVVCDNLGCTFKNRLKSIAPNRGQAKQTLKWRAGAKSGKKHIKISRPQPRAGKTDVKMACLSKKLSKTG
jgi:hypothetical protein